MDTIEVGLRLSDDLRADDLQHEISSDFKAAATAHVQSVAGTPVQLMQMLADPLWWLSASEAAIRARIDGALAASSGGRVRITPGAPPVGYCVVTNGGWRRTRLYALDWRPAGGAYTPWHATEIVQAYAAGLEDPLPADVQGRLSALRMSVAYFVVH